MENNRMSTPWNAIAFFENLTKTNKLAVSKKFVFVQISGLHGLEEAVAQMQNVPNFVMVNENAVGATDLDNSPHTRSVRTVFFAMRHVQGDMKSRAKCMETMRELHRQFLSKIMMEKTRLAENMQYLVPRITLQEVDQYLIPGTAMCMFEIAVDTYIDLSYNADEWITVPSN